MRTRGNPIPDNARAALLTWTPGNGSLNALARSLDVNPSSARTLRSRVHRREHGVGIRGSNESRQADRCGVEVICSPDDQFPIGNKFTEVDLRWMVKLSGMVDGTVFEVTRRDGSVYRCVMQGGELVEVE